MTNSCLNLRPIWTIIYGMNVSCLEPSLKTCSYKELLLGCLCYMSIFSDSMQCLPNNAQIDEDSVVINLEQA